MTMNIGEAIQIMKAGGKARRTEWPDAFGQGVGFQDSEEYSDPIFYMTLVNGQEHPFSPSHRDLAADDWEITEEPPARAKPGARNAVPQGRRTLRKSKR